MIHSDLKSILDNTASIIAEHLKTNPKLTLLYVCTHNSRRSQFSQVWSAILTEKFGLDDKLDSASAGTEVTACNPRTVDSLKRSGIEFELLKSSKDSTNPIYECSTPLKNSPIMLWSKTITDSSIKKPIIAFMTCSDADENCPIVPGALHRIRLTYEDPKLSDGTPNEAQVYDTRSEQIASELSYLFERLTTILQ